MCLACNRRVGAHGTKAIKNLLVFKTKDKKEVYFPAQLHTHDNGRIDLTKEQTDEIIKHASVVIATGVDMQIDIWAVQWPRDYIVKTLSREY